MEDEDEDEEEEKKDVKSGRSLHNFRGFSTTNPCLSISQIIMHAEANFSQFSLLLIMQ